MKHKSILICLVVPLLISCNKDTNLARIGAKLADISHGRYQLESIGCVADYYVNGQHYFNVPKIGKGMYVYYKDSKSQFPTINFVDNREGILAIDRLPIKDVRSIHFQDEALFVISEGEAYHIIMDDEGLPVVKRIRKDRFAKEHFTKNIRFLPVIWSKDFMHSYRNTFLALADTGMENYSVGATPRINCIKTFALYYSYKDVGGKRVRVNYFSGETAYSYFIFNIDNGQMRYVDKDQYIENLMEAHLSKNVYLINSADYYLREHALKGLRYEQHYEINESNLAPDSGK